MISVGKEIIVDGGVWSLWRGNGLNILKIVPENGIRFYVFETAKRYLHQHRNQKYAKEDSMGQEKRLLHLPAHDITTSTRFMAGGMAGLASQISIYPLETVKIRMMTEHLSKPSSGASIGMGGARHSMIAMSAFDVAKKMWKREGIRPFFRGLGPSLMGIVPYVSIDLTAYETFKNTYIRNTGNREPSPSVHLLCGATSGTE